MTKSLINSLMTQDMSQRYGHGQCQDRLIVTRALTQYGVYMNLGTIRSNTPLRNPTIEPL